MLILNRLSRTLLLAVAIGTAVPLQASSYLTQASSYFQKYAKWIVGGLAVSALAYITYRIYNRVSTDPYGLGFNPRNLTIPATNSTPAPSTAAPASAPASSSSAATSSRAVENYAIPTFADWKERCDNLLQAAPAPDPEAGLTLTVDEFMRAIHTYEQCVSNLLSRPQDWLGNMPNHEELTKQETNVHWGYTSESFVPYAQKLVVDPNTEIAFHGDLHGDIHALNEFIQHLNDSGYMQGFNIIKDNFYMIFLGDYTDRGQYGAEVWYTILCLKIANPHRVFMTRGNHEDRTINGQYGFTSELRDKKLTAVIDPLYKLYNLLPVALYVGSGTPAKTYYLLCCHGGIELGFNPKPLFADPRPLAYTRVLDKRNMLHRAPAVAILSEDAQKEITVNMLNRSVLEPKEIQVAHDMGFLWNDFNVNPKAPSNYQYNRGWQFSKRVTLDVLNSQTDNNYELVGIFRAHQHGDYEMMNRILNNDNAGAPEDAGVGKLWTDHEMIKQPQALWRGIVCTFLVAPSYYGSRGVARFDYDAFGILRTANDFEDWRLQVFRVQPKVSKL